MTSEDQPARGGLRERKKAKTRAAIRHHALRLFREQGYTNTTVEQIAAAAEISHMTFFRYFPTKEDVLTNDYGPLIISAFQAQPRDLSPVQALRAALHALISSMTAEELEDFRQRQALALEIPQLQAAALTGLSQTIQTLTEAIAERAGHDQDSLEVRTLAGALTGVMISAVIHWARHPQVDMPTWIDQALSYLQDGLPR